MIREHAQPAGRHPRRSLARRAGLAVALLLLAGSSVRAQPHAEGAVSTLEDKPKSTSPVPFTPVCEISADELAAGHECAGVLDCTVLGTCDFAGGLDHVAAGVGLRNRGAGTIGLAGAPPGAVAVGAWLYWGLVIDGSEMQPDDLTTIVLDGVELDGELAGATYGPCWGDVPGEGSSELRAYRASVLDRLHPGINGDYPVEVPSSSVTDGRDPWRDAQVPPPWVDGASLVVLYAHPDVPRGARFSLHDGAELLLGDLDVVHALDAVPAGTAVLRHTRLGGGGQRHAGYAPTFPFTTSIVWDPIACDQVGSPQIRGPDSGVDPVSDWKGGDGGPITQLWDTQVTELVWTEDVSGCGEYRISYATAVVPEPDPDTGVSPAFFFDCVVVVAHAMTLR